jgi:hypothetical protein
LEHAKAAPAIFTVVCPPIEPREARVLEDGLSISQVETMITKIRCLLVVIPLEMHRAIILAHEIMQLRPLCSY